MDTDPELIPRAVRPPCRTRARRGIAMVTAMFAMVVVGILAAGMYNLATLHAEAVRNRTAATRALLLAESAAAHAVMLLRDSLAKKSNTNLLRGSDNDPAATADNGLLIGFGLSSAVQIPATGVATAQGRYWVQLLDDQAETDGNVNRDSNQRLIARCRSATPDSSYATIDVLISGVGLLPGWLTNGNASISGSMKVLGACGDIHSNGNLSIGSTTTVTGNTSATGSISGSSNIVSTGTTLSNQAPMDVPVIGYDTFCPGSADYIARADGWIVRPKLGDSLLATSDEKWGFKRSGTSPLIWDVSGSNIGAGFWCVTGNVKLSGNPGTALAPIALSLVATGSVEISGNPYVYPATADSISIVSGGDVSISGNPDVATHNYSGLIYATSQCKISGNPRLFGQLVCRNAPNAASTVNYADLNEISGNAEVSYGCGGYFNQPRRILQWVQLVQ